MRRGKLLIGCAAFVYQDFRTGSTSLAKSLRPRSATSMGRAAETESHVQLEVAEQGAPVFKPAHDLVGGCPNWRLS